MRTDIPAELITLHGAPRVRLCDLSSMGARLQCTQPLHKGAQAVLSWLDFETFGTMVWVDGVHVGMEFDEQLCEKAVLETRAIIDAGKVLHSREAAYDAARKWYMGLR